MIVNDDIEKIILKDDVQNSINYLTSNELSVDKLTDLLHLVIDGEKSKEIAKQLLLKGASVREERQEIRFSRTGRKMVSQNKASALSKCIKNGRKENAALLETILEHSIHQNITSEEISSLLIYVSSHKMLESAKVLIKKGKKKKNLVFFFFFFILFILPNKIK